jgi:predicted small secreted protein
MIRILLAAALVLTGCAPINTDEVMGRTVSTPTTAPKKLLDCDLIFPAPARDTLAP